MAELDSRGIVPEENIKIQNYIDNMDDVIAASDLIISRAGALSVAEILVTGRASVLIPSPNVTGNHQYFNAKAVADKGGAILIEEKDIDEDKFKEIVKELRNDTEKLENMGQKAHELAARSASEIYGKQQTPDKTAYEKSQTQDYTDCSGGGGPLRFVCAQGTCLQCQQV